MSEFQAKKNLSLSETAKILKKQKIVCSFWECSDERNTTYQNYYLLFKKLFGRVILFDPRKERWTYGPNKVDEAFLSLVEKEKPDYIFTNVRRDYQTIETMMKVKEISPSTKTLMFSGDDDTDFVPLKRYQALFVDCTLVAQTEYIEDYYKDRIKNTYPIIPSNEESNKPMNLKKIYDVTFIGKPNKYRVEDLKFLINKGVNVKIFGKGWEEYPDLKEFYGGQPNMEEKIKIVNQSKINLSLSKNKEGVPHFKGRVFSRASCKAFSLTEYFEGYKKFFEEGKEIIMFKNHEDLLKKIKYYLKNERERERISENAYKKYMQNYTGVQQFLVFFNHLIKNKGIFSQKFPKLEYKIISLKKEDMEKNKEEIKRMIKDYDCVSFQQGKFIESEYKNYLLAYSLEKTKKTFALCDYTIYRKTLGDYLLTNIWKAIKRLDKERFAKALSLNQIAVKKEFFLKNIQKFRSFFEKEFVDIINLENTAFISLPLIKIKKIPKMDSKTFSVFFHQKLFINEIYFLLKKKRLLLSRYFYRLALLSIIHPKLIKSLIGYVTRRKNWGAVK